MIRVSAFSNLAGCTIILLLAGCARSDKPVGIPIEQAWERPAPPSPPASATATASGTAGTQPAELDSADIIAVVNGTPIARSSMVRTLLDSHGLSLLEQLILLNAARQRGAKMGLAVTSADVQAAHEDALRRLATPVGGIDEQTLDRQVTERLLKEFLVAKNISRVEWDRRMEQQAWLRKIAVAEFEKTDVTNDMLREEYGLEFGERVQVRHIQVSSLQAAARVRAALTGTGDSDSPVPPAAGQSVSARFELVARQYSENQLTAARGGLMPPFTRNEPTVTPLIREAAFSLQPGQFSPPVHETGGYHILLLERRFPASSVGFENVDHARLRQRFLDRRIRQRVEILDGELFKTALIDVRDPELARQFRARYR